MDQSIVVWIVEDSEADARDAWNVVSRVSGEFSAGLEIYWAADFEWEQAPALRPAVDNSLPPVARSDHPDIVILDLCLGTERGEELRADTFYKKLREYETHKSGRPSLIVLWSLHQGRKDTDDFVRELGESDPRVIALGSKTEQQLTQKLSHLWRRVLEEREEPNG